MRPSTVLRRACFLRLQLFIEKPIDSLRPIPVREYEYSGIEKLTKKKLVILYRERL